MTRGGFRSPSIGRGVDLGEATTIAGAKSYASARLCLVVVGENTFATFPLPDEGSVRIGRSDRNDIRIDDPSVSREHAVLHLGEKLVLEDLGGANGTSVHKVPVPPRGKAEVVPGQVIDLGFTLAIVQKATAQRPRRLWTHDYFEARIEDECSRAERAKATFTVLRLHVDEADRSSAAVREVLTFCLSSIDVVAAYGPGEYEVLLLDTPADKAKELVSRILSELDTWDLGVRTGLATYPSDGRSPEALIAKANQAVRGPRAESKADRPVIIRDNAMLELHRVVERVAAGTISVMLLGETGVGKEIIAERVHQHSPRAKKPFVRLNCAALTETLLESELFGHEKGAFTGAVQAKPGLLESADGGTVFLDEIGELPMPLQVKLLRVLEDRKVLRVGSLKPKEIDVRFISATNRDLEAEVMNKRFRADLYFRLNGISLMIPPLRERVPEIEPLARAFLEQVANQANLPSVPELTQEAFKMLERYSWPGNIRELRNVIERAVLLSLDGQIRPEHLPVEKMRATLLAPGWEERPSRPISPPTDAGQAPRAGLDDPTLPVMAAAPPPGLTPDEIAERKEILETLERCGGNQTQAAKILGMSRRTLVSRLDKYQLPRPRKGAP